MQTEQTPQTEQNPTAPTEQTSTPEPTLATELQLLNEVLQLATSRLKEIGSSSPVDGLLYSHISSCVSYILEFRTPLTPES